MNKDQSPKPRSKKDNPARYVYHIEKSIEIRDKLKLVMSEFEDKTPKGAKFNRLVQLFWEGLPGPLDRRVIEDSLLHCVGVHLTRELLYQTCWRMAGNIPRLRHDKVVPPWHVQRIPEWVALHVVASRPERNSKRQLGSNFAFRVVGGTSCPLIIHKWWSLKQCRFYAREGFGFTRNIYTRDDPKYQFSDPAQLVNLRLYGLVEPALCSKEPMFAEMEWPAAARVWNREIIKHRFRIDPGYECPKKYPLSLACHHCHMGFYKCPGGCHRKNWIEKKCPVCGTEDALFDPEILEDRCIDCNNKRALKR